MPDTSTRIDRRAGARDGHIILAIQGPLTVASAPELRKAGDGLTARAIIMDLTAVPFLDSSAIGVLVHFYTRSRQSGGQLILVGLNDRVRKTLKNMSVDKLFQIYPTLAEAESALS
jgi:anti-sigma B factor antagonist